MQVRNQAMSLFNYLENQAASDQALKNAADKQSANNIQDLSLVNLGISQGNFDEMLSEMEKGTLNVNLKTMGNYVDFNMQKLNREVGDLAQSFGLNLPTEISLEDGKLSVLDDSPAGQSFQDYLDKDSRLNSLAQQTGKLSQFYEWGLVREQAGSYQNSGVDDDNLLGFLQEGREKIVHQNRLLIDSDGVQYLSQGQSGQLAEKFNEQFGYDASKNGA